MTIEKQPQSKPQESGNKKNHPLYVAHDVTTENGKSIWSKVGSAWTAKNGYLTLKLDENRHLVLQPWSEYEKHYLQKREVPVSVCEDNVSEDSPSASQS